MFWVDEYVFYMKQRRFNYYTDLFPADRFVNNPVNQNNDILFLLYVY